MAYYGQGYGYQTGSHPPPQGHPPAPGPAFHQQPGPAFQQSPSYGGDYDVFKQNVMQAFQSIDPTWDLHAEFQQAMNSSPDNMTQGGIQAEDLQHVMNKCETVKRHFFNIHWSLELCKIMIKMMDRRADGFMQEHEFMELQNCLVQWFNTFRQYDVNRSGYIEAGELTQVITQGYKYALSPQAMETLLKKYSRVHQNTCIIAFDDFVALSVRLRAYTEIFREHDRRQHGHETGSATFSYNDFIQSVIGL